MIRVCQFIAHATLHPSWLWCAAISFTCAVLSCGLSFWQHRGVNGFLTSHDESPPFQSTQQFLSPQMLCQGTAKRQHLEYAERKEASADCTCDCAWLSTRIFRVVCVGSVGRGAAKWIKYSQVPYLSILRTRWKVRLCWFQTVRDFCSVVLDIYSTRSLHLRQSICSRKGRYQGDQHHQEGNTLHAKEWWFWCMEEHVWNTRLSGSSGIDCMTWLACPILATKAPMEGNPHPGAPSSASV